MKISNFEKSTKIIWSFIYIYIFGGGQKLEQPNLERSIFWNFEISNIRRTEGELFDFFIFAFIYYFCFVLII